MIITSSSIGMESNRIYTSVSTDAYLRTRSVNTISGTDFINSLSNAEKAREITDKEKTDEDKKSGEKSDTLSENSEGSLEYLKGKFKEISTGKIAKISKQEEDLRSTIKYLCMNFLLMLLFGKNAGYDENNTFLKNMGFSGSKLMTYGNGFSVSEITDQVAYEHTEAEFEGTTFSGKGIVKTADGREIDFAIDLTMSRSFEKKTQEIGASKSFALNLMDPLVINLDTYAADVSDQKFYFDLDADGKEDEVSMLSSSSGFLALDLNGDGKINDGSELFGTKSGDGFKDLAQYDKDGNGWIDEADEVFDRLKIFCINEDGTTSQYTLKEKGVGAICLNNEDTEFTITDQENNVNAQVRKTGMFLYEKGSVGTLQHVDLAVELGA